MSGTDRQGLPDRYTATGEKIDKVSRVLSQVAIPYATGQRSDVQQDPGAPLFEDAVRSRQLDSMRSI